MYRKHCAPAVQPGQVSCSPYSWDTADQVAHLAGGLQNAPPIHIVYAEVEGAER